MLHARIIPDGRRKRSSFAWAACGVGLSGGGRRSAASEVMVMWSTIGWLSLMCAIFIGMLVALSIIGLEA